VYHCFDYADGVWLVGECARTKRVAVSSAVYDVFLQHRRQRANNDVLTVYLSRPSNALKKHPSLMLQWINNPNNLSLYLTTINAITIFSLHKYTIEQSVTMEAFGGRLGSYGLLPAGSRRDDTPNRRLETDQPETSRRQTQRPLNVLHKKSGTI
jgi:hypothetical protein